MRRTNANEHTLTLNQANTRCDRLSIVVVTPWLSQLWLLQRPAEPRLRNSGKGICQMLRRFILRSAGKTLCCRGLHSFLLRLPHERSDAGRSISGLLPEAGAITPTGSGPPGSFRSAMPAPETAVARRRP